VAGNCAADEFSFVFQDLRWLHGFPLPIWFLPAGVTLYHNIH